MYPQVQHLVWQEHDPEFPPLPAVSRQPVEFVGLSVTVFIVIADSYRHHA